MLKGLFLCALLAVLSANSMAQPTGSADPDAIMEREVRGIVSGIFGVLKNLARAGLNAAMNQKREAELRNAETFSDSAHSKRFISLLLRPLLGLIARGKRDANSI